jgi:protocatechuate 3,4-dioxygenase beta subunit
MTRSVAAPLWRQPSIDLTRRRALLGLGAGVAGAVLMPRSGSAQAPGNCVLTPDSGEGPFYFDPELVRTDIAGDAAGASLSLDIRVVRERDCAVLDGARVDVWHADAVGLYSGYERQPGVGGGVLTDARGQTFLRGTQFTDREGRVHFDTIYPSWYGGRTPHVHFKIFLSDREVVASQIFFPDEFNNEVFERFEPYRTHRARRTGFNANDMFLSDGVDGLFGIVARRPEGYDATAALVVRT